VFGRGPTAARDLCVAAYRAAEDYGAIIGICPTLYRDRRLAGLFCERDYARRREFTPPRQSPACGSPKGSR
jgi:hypothetical protein